MENNRNIKELKNKIIESPIIDEIAKRYVLTLKLVNVILHNAGYEEIDDLTKFKDINREALISEENDDEFSKLLPEIYKVFGKRICQFSQKKYTKYYILTVLKNMCREISLDLKQKYKNKQVNSVVKSYVLYSIVYI